MPVRPAPRQVGSDDLAANRAVGTTRLHTYWTSTGDLINVQAVYTDGATRYNLQSLAVVSYSMFGGSGLAGAYQSVGFANAPDAVFTDGAGLESVRTWGFRGAYTHN